jgi:prevent-host-death family protein
MQILNIHEAKAQFSKLIEAVAKGEEVLIAKSGKPAAMLVPVSAHKPVRKPGAMKGNIRIVADFDGPLPDELQSAFESC